MSSSQLYKQSDIYKLGKTVQQIISVEKTVSIGEEKLMDGKNNYSDAELSTDEEALASNPAGSKVEKKVKEKKLKPVKDKNQQWQRGQS